MIAGTDHEDTLDSALWRRFDEAAVFIFQNCPKSENYFKDI